MEEVIDWPRAWMAPWRQVGRAVVDRMAHGAPLHAALSEAADAVPDVPVRFTTAQALPVGEHYESFISSTAQVPVRPGLHDFFNGLCWLQFPRAKASLNRLQAQAIARDGIAGRRGPVRDAITVFDENGALLDAPPELWEALLARDWRRLFIDLRPLWDDARLLVFGHALLEQLVQPRKNLTAHVWRANCRWRGVAEADAWLAQACTGEALAAKPFTPLPVLGVPGWWAPNENFSFYDDSHVFRPRRTPESTTTTRSAGPARP